MVNLLPWEVLLCSYLRVFCVCLDKTKNNIEKKVVQLEKRKFTIMLYSGTARNEKLTVVHSTKTKKEGTKMVISIKYKINKERPP